MVKSSNIAAAAALLLTSPAVVAGMYTKSSPVLQLDGHSYDSLIAHSNHTSIVEFYAPWCGHCKNLKPAYEKAAKSLSGLAKVAAIDCDDDNNKPFCGSMGVQGFPTLKIVRPSKKGGRPTVEDYQGPRTAKGIVDAVIDKIPNHVKRLKDADYLSWIGQDDEPRAVLVTDKGTVSALFKSIAIDFLGTISFAQIRDKEAQAFETLDIQKVPTLLLLPGGDKEAVRYDGEMKREAIVEFLSQVGPPNPDPASSSKKGKEAKPNKKKAGDSKVADQSSDNQGEAKSRPVKAPEVAPPIRSLIDEASAQQECLNSKAGTCVLAILPDEEIPSATTLQALSSLSEINFKHGKGKRSLFPFYQLSASNTIGSELRKQLKLTDAGAEIIAINGKKGWWRHYSSNGFQIQDVESWVDAIRMGDLSKQDLPKDLVVDAADLPAEPVKPVQETPDVEAMREAFKAALPEGVDLELDSLSDEEYEEILRQGAEAAKGGHDEL